MSELLDRTPCLITGCRRTVGHTTALKRWGYVPYEWICSRHWGLLTGAERRVWYRHTRFERRTGFPRNDAAYHRVWAGLVRRVEAACRDG